jgi:phage terminase large subunit GpA-like protein
MRERNEALDCRVYARAAAARVGLDRFQEKHWEAMEQRVGRAEHPAPHPEPSKERRRGGRKIRGRFL